MFRGSGVASFLGEAEYREAEGTVESHEWNLAPTDPREYGIDEARMLPQIGSSGMWRGGSSIFESYHSGNWEYGAKVVTSPEDLQACASNQVFDLWQRVTTLMLEEHVMSTPEEGERWDSDQESRAWRSGSEVAVDESGVVVDVLKDVHHQDKVCAGGSRRLAQKADRLSGNSGLAIVGITGVDTGSLACGCGT